MAGSRPCAMSVTTNGWVKRGGEKGDGEAGRSGISVVFIQVEMADVDVDYRV